MNSARRHTTLLHLGCATVFCLVGVVAPNGVRADGAPATAQRILLLINGQSLQGQIEHLGDYYLVTSPTAEIRIPVDQVEGICHSLEEVYLRGRNKAQFGDAIGHLKLSQWCLDRGLRRQAQEQLDLAVGKQPNHPRIALIQRQLSAPPPIPAGRESPTAMKQRPVTSAADLNDLVRRMPPGTMEGFTRLIQPVLLNGCSARACHGSAGDNDLRLIKFARGQLPPRLLTLRNLNETAAWIDYKRPADSPLLSFATQPHGERRVAPLATDSTPYRRLAEWVSQVAGDNAPPAAPAERPVALVTARPPLRSPPDGADRAKSRLATLHNRDAQGSTGRSAAKTPPEDVLSPRPEARPKDPFDPNIFNRRYHPTEP